MSLRGNAGTVRLVLDSGLETQKGIEARVVRIDGQLGLALLRVEGKSKYPALPLGSDKDLSELTELVAFGFPFGKPLMFNKDSFPSVRLFSPFPRACAGRSNAYWKGRARSRRPRIWG